MKKSIFLIGLLAVAGGIAVSANGKNVNQVNAGEIPTRLMDPEADINYAKARDAYFRDNFDYTEEYRQELMNFKDWCDYLPSYSSEARNYIYNFWGAYYCFNRIDSMVNYLETEKDNLTTEQYNYANSIIQELLEKFKVSHTSMDSEVYGAEYEQKLKDYIDAVKYIPETKEKILDFIEAVDLLKNKDDIEELKEQWFAQLDTAKTRAECDAVYDSVVDLSSELEQERQLQEAKAKALKELQKYIDELDTSEFNEGNMSQLEEYQTEYSYDIEHATTVDEVEKILKKAKKKISQIVPIGHHTLKGCNGSMVATTGLISVVSALGVALVTAKKKEN